MKEQAKVNFGMANASLKWNNHITGILQQIDDLADDVDAKDNQDENVAQVDEVAEEAEDDGN